MWIPQKGKMPAGLDKTRKKWHQNAGIKEKNDSVSGMSADAIILFSFFLPCAGTSSGCVSLLFEVLPERREPTPGGKGERWRTI